MIQNSLRFALAIIGGKLIFRVWSAPNIFSLYGDVTVSGIYMGRWGQAMEWLASCLRRKLPAG